MNKILCLVGLVFYYAYAIPVDYAPLLKGALDGVFVSFGMEAGGGAMISSSVSDNLNITKIIQTTGNSHAEMVSQLKKQAYANAIARLRNNQAQTKEILLRFAKEVAQLSTHQNKENDFFARFENMLVGHSQEGLEQYQAYLNEKVAYYEKQNAELIAQARIKVRDFYDKYNQANIDHSVLLAQGVVVYQYLSEQIALISKNLGVADTTPPLDFNINSISLMDAPRIYQALLDINKNIGMMQESLQDKIVLLKDKNNSIVKAFDTKLDNLSKEALNLKQQVLNEVVTISQNFAKEFHQNWEQLMVGKKFGNDLNNIALINNGRSCALLLLFGEGSDGGTCGKFSVPKPTWDKSLDISVEQVWNTLFNIGQLGTKVIIQAPNVVGGGQGTNGVPNATYEKEIHDAFNFLDKYGIGNPNFVGNFKHSMLYELLQVALDHNAFNDFDTLLNNYTTKMIPYMLNVFSNPEDPFWAMGVKSSQLEKYCANRHGQLPVPSLWGGYQASFCEYNSWSNSYYLGVLYFSQEEIKKIVAPLQAQGNEILSSVNSELTPLTSQLAQLQHKGPQTYAIPNFNPITLKTPTNFPNPPKFNTQPTALPNLISPTNFTPNNHYSSLSKGSSPISFSTQNLKANTYSLGLHTQFGYQKYVNPFIGFSTYAEFGYRYNYTGRYKTYGLSSLNQYRFGIGENVIFNFYSDIKLYEKRAIIRAYGLFAGLLGVANLYTFQSSNKMLNDFNMDLTFGLRIRHDNSLWILGAKIPLINQVLHTPYEHVKLIDNYHSSSVFLSFTKFFKRL
ncbi:outer membrane beta-barrel protein [Helicobacter cetorum]|uniref:Outer membrane protein n=1 Tax=Helicobacter cetorum (strain ATCC BAA-540 / CCUG 52418 / MIT 99-5656) TaxID=1163745 RepID=I0EQG3_HELCM|nr:outer membrane beta-barrel protein [Helicobacter cetorum]AFI05182.1 outer membrane protein [Helicobacter cetorum MIT 99-5656]